MRKKIIAVIILAILAVISSNWMERNYSLEPKLSHQTRLSDFPLLMVVSIFHLEDLFVGYLWLQFDVDSLGAVGNYHRLLGTLDLITTVKPDEFHAWGLATFMRYKHWTNEGNVKKAIQSINELHKAQQRFPSIARGWYELAYMYGLVLRDTPKALKYATQAYSIEPNYENTLMMQTLQRVYARSKGLISPVPPPLSKKYKGPKLNK
tara:strand:- start:1338 stop:1958 length:621 start_codon:yes stop_codon:yes gene_type:complete